MAPEVAAERSAALKRWRERKAAQKAQRQSRERLEARSIVRFNPKANMRRTLRHGREVSISSL
jgi:hypothetical protein